MTQFDALSFAGAGLCAAFNEESFRERFQNHGPLQGQLSAILRQRNGFYSYGGSILFRSFGACEAPLDLVQWNSPGLWAGAYKIDFGETLFFAEDIFGYQFCIRDGAISLFDPESGLFEVISSDFLELSESLRKDRNGLSGKPFLEEWTKVHGPLAVGKRLMPKLPFVCGGQFNIANFAAIIDSEGMLFRADLYNQIKNVPDGGKIVLRIDDAIP